MKDGWKETMEACLECEKPTSVDMEPEVDHREIPKEDTLMKPVEGRRKWCRDWNLAMERRQKPKERIRGYCGSQKRVTAVSSMTRCAGVAWLRRNAIKKDQTRKQVE
jgi:hypothetical protein